MDYHVRTSVEYSIIIFAEVLEYFTSHMWWAISFSGPIFIGALLRACVPTSYLQTRMCMGA